MDKKTIKYIFGALRKIWGWSAERKQVKERCKVGKVPYVYKCEECEDIIYGRKAKKVPEKAKKAHKDIKLARLHIDHIKPVIDPEKGFTDWNSYISRLFCPIENLQGLCEPCHKEKTKKERVIRTKYNKIRREK